MLPDLHWTTIHLGPIVIQVWGLFVALGIVAAIAVAQQFAKEHNLNAKVVMDGAFWIVLSAMLGSRIWYVVTEWQSYAGHWGDAWKIWLGGMSISGGFVGALIAGVIYFRLKKVSFWQYAEAMIYGLPLGLAIGRLGCFFIFDHPGVVTNFFLGEIYYGDGAVRHNHGLYLALNGLIMFLVFWYLRRRNKNQMKPPYFLTLFLIWYGTARLLLDSLRIYDSEWLGLTAAQWLGMVMIATGLAMFGTRQIIRKRYL